MYFKVFDKNGNEITKDAFWVITSEGEICYRSYGDLIGIEGIFAVLYFNDGRSRTVFNNKEDV